MHSSFNPVVESVRQLADNWEAVVRDRGTGDIEDRPGIAIRWADNRFPFWNCVTLTEQGCDDRSLEKSLSETAAYMRGKRETGLVWLFEDLLDPPCRAQLPEIADRAGFALSLTAYGMAGDILPVDEPHHPALDFVRVTTEEQLTAYADLNSRAYGMPLEAGRAGLGGSALWKTGIHAYLGLANGRPVSAAAVRASGDSLFAILVATAPEEQRKGYGEATLRKALFEGGRATGLTRTVLHATEAGAPVYARIGYQKVGRIGLYALKS